MSHKKNIFIQDYVKYDDSLVVLDYVVIINIRKVYQVKESNLNFIITISIYESMNKSLSLKNNLIN